MEWGPSPTSGECTWHYEVSGTPWIDGSLCHCPLTICLETWRPGGLALAADLPVAAQKGAEEWTTATHLGVFIFAQGIFV